MTLSVPASTGLAPRLPAIAATVTVVLWASAFVAIRALADVFSPGAMAFLRLFAAVIVLTVIVVAVRLRDHRPIVDRLPRGGTIGLVAGYGVAWFAGYTVLLNWAERHLDAGTSALLVNVAPLLVAIFAGLFLGDGFPRPLVVGMAIGFAGVAVIAVAGGGGDGGGGLDADWLGVGLGLAAAVLYATGVLLQKFALTGVDALTATWLGALAGLVATLPFAPQAIAELADADGGALVAVFYLGIGPTAIAFTTWAYALARTRASAMAATTLVVPAIVVLLSWLLLGELPTIAGVIGGVLCLGGVVVARGLLPMPVRRPAAARIVERVHVRPGG
ncbi:DMT family transporter [Gordonia sp. ABSL1-1]|uniref:DMT family transporter n=1 Tax=Gordonia sp. ABSL1-1 TaxID=3053923 RepID=UPI00257284DC|nr:DMT family transporter [Gordonia sp. ABSL1-1]MDL9938402.1 DMT family transporter [Gordonia sp. ABSL1-1]